MKVGITPAERGFLFYISQKGPKTGYALGKETAYSEKTAYEAAKSLVKKGLLTRKVIDQTRAKKDMISYNLTLAGLLTILWLGILTEFLEEEKDPPAVAQETIESIADHWPDLLHLILGKWSLFKEYQVEDFARNSLLLLTPLFLNQPGSNHIAGPFLTIVSVFTDDDIHRAFFRATIEGINTELSQYQDKWRQVCRKDREISALLVDDLSRQIEEKDRQVRELRHELQLIQKKD